MLQSTSSTTANSVQFSLRELQQIHDARIALAAAEAAEAAQLAEALRQKEQAQAHADAEAARALANAESAAAALSATLQTIREEADAEIARRLASIKKQMHAVEMPSRKAKAGVSRRFIGVLVLLVCGCGIAGVVAVINAGEATDAKSELAADKQARVMLRGQLAQARKDLETARANVEKSVSQEKFAALAAEVARLEKAVGRAPDKPEKIRDRETKKPDKVPEQTPSNGATFELNDACKNQAFADC